MTSPDQERSMMRTVLLLTLARLFTNMTRRFYYPFIPEISRSLDVSRGQVQTVVASQAGVGIISPLLGGLAERYGRKRIMVAALLGFTLAALLGFLIPDRYSVFYLVMVVWGLCKWLFDPAMQAYISERVSYLRRGLAIGVTELAWSGALVVSAPLTGVLLGLDGLQWVYGMLLACNSLGLLIVWRFVPSDVPTGQQATGMPFSQSARILLGSRPALAALGFSILLYAANEMLLINFGVWMESTFDLSLESLGLVTLATIATAEIIGEGVVVVYSDRIGKRRLALLMTFLSALGYLALPHLNFALPAAMLGVFYIFVTVEIAIVSSIPLFTEVLPQARAVMMSSVVASQGVGRFTGAFLGGALYAAFSFPWVGLGACLLGLGAYALMQWRIQEQG